jgi:hypothetical protein
MTITAAVRRRVREAAQGRCGYCLMPAQVVQAPMEIDHIIPPSAGGTDDEENLWLACPRCNVYKSAQTHPVDPESGETVALFNPRKQVWKEHFAWDDTGAHIIGLTPCGRATVVALKMNLDEVVAFRRLIASVGWYPPKI